MAEKAIGFLCFMISISLGFGHYAIMSICPSPINSTCLERVSLCMPPPPASRPNHTACCTNMMACINETGIRNIYNSFIAEKMNGMDICSGNATLFHLPPPRPLGRDRTTVRGGGGGGGGARRIIGRPPSGGFPLPPPPFGRFPPLPGNFSFPMGFPPLPGNFSFPMGFPPFPGNFSFPMGFPPFPGNFSFPMGFPPFPGNFSLPLMGFPPQGGFHHPGFHFGFPEYLAVNNSAKAAEFRCCMEQKMGKFLTDGTANTTFWNGFVANINNTTARTAAQGALSGCLSASTGCNSMNITTCIIQGCVSGL